MAWLLLNEGLYWPRYDPAMQASTSTLNSTTIRQALVLRSPRTAALTGVRFSVGTVTTPENLTIALEGVTGGMAPDDVESQTATYALAGGDANTTIAVTFGSSRQLAKGELFAVVIRWTSTAGNMTFKQTSAGAGAITGGKGWAYVAAWAAAGFTYPCFSFNWSDDVHVCTPGIYPVPGTGNSWNADLSLNSGTTPDEIGLRLVSPVSGRIAGVFVNHVSTSGATADVKLYDSASNVLFSRAVQYGVEWQSGAQRVHMLSAPIHVRKGDVLRVTAALTSGTSTAWPRVVLDSNARLACLPLGDVEAYRTERTDGGAWTDTTTERMQHFGVIYDAIDDGGAPAPSGWAQQGTVLYEAPPIVIPG